MKGNQWAAAEHPPSDPRGPDQPDGRAQTAPAPRPVPPAQTRGTRDWSDPDRPVELAPPRRFHTELCMHARDPSRARPPPGRLTPPYQGPPHPR